MRKFHNSLLYLFLVFTVIQPASLHAQRKNYVIQVDENSTENVSMEPQRVVKVIDEYTLEITYNFPGFTVTDVEIEEDVYQILSVHGFGLDHTTGEPSLPVRTDKVALPSTNEPKLSVITKEYVELDGYRIFPAQEMLADNATDRLGFSMSQETYNSNTFFPENLAVIEDLQIYRSAPLACIRIRPVQYNPLLEKVRFYKNFSIRLEFKPEDKSVISKTNKKTTQDYSILQNTVVNPFYYKKNLEIQKDAVAADPIGYLILTTPDFRAASDSLANWKRQLGFDVKIISQSSWTSKQVKSTVQLEYTSANTPPSYLLIIGDHDDVPAETKEEDDKTIYMSVYYTCMDGPTDKLPDMAQGRIPIHNPDEAMVVVKKIIEYEKNPPADADFYRNALHCAYFEEHPNATSTSYKRYIYTAEESREYMMDQGFNIQRVYTTEPHVSPLNYSSWFADGGHVPDELLRSNGFTWNGDRNDIINGVNEGALYLFHRDHGLIDGWRDPKFNNTDVAELNNGNKLPIVFSVNCHTGRFQNTYYKCFAETLLHKENGGAVGVIAATEQTYSGYNDALIEGFLDAIWPDPGLVPNFGSSFEVVADPEFTPHEPIYAMGDILNQGLLRMTETWNGWARDRQYERYHYFGDPAMKIWTDHPIEIAAQHTSVIETGSNTIEITQSNCPDGLATICINNELKDQIRLGNGTGIFTLSEPVGVDDKVVLTISKHNFRPYVKTIGITTEPIPDLTLDILPLGNSLTSGDYVNDTRPASEKIAYRKYLADLLKEKDIKFDYVGSETTGNSFLDDTDHAGFQGMTASQLANLLKTGYNAVDNIQETPAWYLDAYLPDVILLHIAADDYSSDVSDIELILDEIDAYKNRNETDTKVILAKIVNQIPIDQDISTYNSNLEQLIKNRADTSLHLVDMEIESGIKYAIEPGGDMRDQYHPNPYGYQKMAQIWMEGITSSVNNISGIPQFLNAEDITVNLGDTVYLDFFALASEKPVYTLTNKKATMQFDETLGILNWISDEEGEFTMTLSAVNSHGSSSIDIQVKVVNSNVAPLPPESLSTRINPGSIIILDWEDVSENELGFYIERSINGGSFIQISAQPANIETYSESISLFDVPYTYRVRAWNAYGESPYITSIAVIKPSQPDIKIAGYDEIYANPTYRDLRSSQRISMPEDGIIQKISMYHGAGGGSLVYAIYDDAGGRPGKLLAKTPSTLVNPTTGWQEVDLETPVSIEADAVFWIAWIYQYIPELRYSFQGPGRATAYENYTGGMPDEFGSCLVADFRYSVYALYQSLEADPVIPFPPAPTELTANFNENVPSINLNWIDNADFEEGFIIERGNGSDAFSIIGELDANSTYFIDASVDFNTYYEYRLYAIGANGNSAYSNTVIVITTFIPPGPPSAPANISIQLSGNATFVINWEDTAGDETGFEIERSINGEDFTHISSLPANSETFSDNISQLDVSYAYRVRSFNNHGESSFINSSTIFVPSVTTMSIAGYDEVYPYQTYRDLRSSQRISMPEDGIVQKISMFHGGGGGMLVYAIYADADGVPGNILGKTSYTPVNSTAGWQEVDLETPVFAEADAIIWIAWIYQYVPELRYSNQGPGRATAYEKYTSGMPDEFGSCLVADFRYSVYALYQPLAANSVFDTPTLTADYDDYTPSISLIWQDNSENEDGYIIERKINAGDFVEYSEIPEDRSEFTDFDINYSTEYTFRVHSFNTSGQSNYSNEAIIFTSEPILNQKNESLTNTIPTEKIITNIGSSPGYSKSINNQPELYIYPNPILQNTLKFKLRSLHGPEKFHFEIFEVTGRVLLKKEMLIEEGVEYEVALEKTTGSSLLIFKLYNEEHSFIQRIALSK